MRILITGGAGCLGSNLIEHWLPQGHEIFVIDNFVTGKREVVPSVDGLSLEEGTITDELLVEEVFSSFKPDVVIHAAAAYKDPDNWIEDSTTNVLGSINIAKASKLHKVKRLINFQTALCYGRPKEVPIPVTHPTRPFTSYGISKTAGEQFMMLSGVPTVSLRIANVTGPRLAIGPIPTFYKRLKAEQNCFCSDTERDFLDMSDFLAFMDIVIKENQPTGLFNVSSGEAHSIKEIFDIVSQYLSLPISEVPIEPVGEDDVPIVSLDPSETHKMFAWKAKIEFKEIINNQLKWYEKYGISDVFSHLKAPNKKD
jgi:UDP-glucose 4-epimerase